MITLAKDIRTGPLLDLYNIQTPLFNSVLKDISDKDAHKRLDTKANHIAWLAGSLVQQRYDLAEMFGITDMKHTAHELFKNNHGIKDGITYPSLQQYKQEWATITPVLKDAVLNTATGKLNSIFTVPEMEFSYYEMLLFSVYREANCIGQIALWRRLLGYEPMKYM